MGPNNFRVVLAYLRAVDAKSRKRILYHGTSPEVGRRVLSEGLVPDPKKRSWGEDPNVGYNTLPRVSFPGVYLTGNLMTAYSSATRTAGPHAEHTIVVVEVEEASLVHDEDTLKGPLQIAMHDLVTKGYILTEDGAIGMYDRLVKGDLDAELEATAEKFLKSVDVPSKAGYAQSRMPVVLDTLKALITRQASYALPSVTWFADKMTWEQMRDDNARHNERDLSSLPPPKEADRLFMKAMERLSDKLKPLHATGLAADRFMDSSRMKGPIGFSGANKVVAVIGVSQNRDEPGRPYQMKFLYGNPSDARLQDFFKQFGTRMSDNYVVVDKSGKTVLEPMKSTVGEKVPHV